MSKRPSFQFYPADWLSDPNVIAMSAEERGAYIQLLAVMWTTEDCSLEDNVEYLSRIAQVDNSVISKIYHCFNAVNGKLRHKRLDSERRKQDENREKRSKGGVKGMQKRWNRSQNHNSVITQDNLSTSSSTSNKIISKDIISTPKKVFEEISDEFFLASLLFQKIQENNPKAKKPDLQKWASEIDKMIRLDGRTVEEIDFIIWWCQQDAFWKANILSATKLREKFDQLFVKAKSQVEKIKAEQVKNVIPNFENPYAKK